MNVLVTVCLMLMAACTASALTCKYCYYTKVKKGRGSNNMDVEELLNDLENDLVEECTEQGQDYIYAKTETCQAGIDYCAMRRFNLKMTVHSVECEIEMFGRACVFSTQNVSAACHKEAPYYEDFFRGIAGVSSVAITGDLCYCSSDLCNDASAVLMSKFAVILAAVFAITSAGVNNSN